MVRLCACVLVCGVLVSGVLAGFGLGVTVEEREERDESEDLGVTGVEIDAVENVGAEIGVELAEEAREGGDLRTVCDLFFGSDSIM